MVRAARTIVTVRLDLPEAEDVAAAGSAGGVRDVLISLAEGSGELERIREGFVGNFAGTEF